jgi:hypothetical protein
MSLAPSEEQRLAEIESKLRWSDPRLAARLAMFRRHAAGRRGPAREPVSPWRASPRGARPGRRWVAWALLAASIILAVLFIALAGRSGPAPASCTAGRSCRPAAASALAKR